MPRWTVRLAARRARHAVRPKASACRSSRLARGRRHRRERGRSRGRGLGTVPPRESWVRTRRRLSDAGGEVLAGAPLVVGVRRGRRRGLGRRAKRPSRRRAPEYAPRGVRGERGSASRRAAGVGRSNPSSPPQTFDPRVAGLRRSWRRRNAGDEHNRDRDGAAVAPACDQSGADRGLAAHPAPRDTPDSPARAGTRFRRLAASLLVARAAPRVPRAPIPVAFALAVLAVLATAAPEQAAAQTVTTFISNTGQGADVSSQLPRATAFTTGTFNRGGGPDRLAGSAGALPSLVVRRFEFPPGPGCRPRSG